MHRAPHLQCHGDWLLINCPACPEEAELCLWTNQEIYLFGFSGLYTFFVAETI